MAIKWSVKKTIKCGQANCNASASVGFDYGFGQISSINSAYDQCNRQNKMYRCGCRCEVVEVEVKD